MLKPSPGAGGAEILVHPVWRHEALVEGGAGGGVGPGAGAGAGEQRPGGGAEGAAPDQQAGEEHQAGLRGGRGRGQGGGQGGPALQGTGDLFNTQRKLLIKYGFFIFVAFLSCNNKD